MMLTTQIKLAIGLAAEAVLIVGGLFAQTTTTNGGAAGFLSGSAFDAGTTLAALGLLAYMMRLLLGGGLVSRSTIESIVEKSVRETLKEIDDAKK